MAGKSSSGPGGLAIALLLIIGIIYAIVTEYWYVILIAIAIIAIIAIAKAVASSNAAEEERKAKEEERIRKEKRKEEERKRKEIARKKAFITSVEPSPKLLPLPNQTEYANELEKYINNQIKQIIAKENKKIQLDSHIKWLETKRKYQLELGITEEVVSLEEINAAKKEVSKYNVAPSAIDVGYQPGANEETKLKQQFKDITAIIKKTNKIAKYFGNLPTMELSAGIYLVFTIWFPLLFNMENMLVKLLSYNDIQLIKDYSLERIEGYVYSSDYEIESRHYRYETKDGSPDKRYNNNSEYTWVYHRFLSIGYDDKLEKIPFKNKSDLDEYCLTFEKYTEKLSSNQYKTLLDAMLNGEHEFEYRALSEEDTRKKKELAEQKKFEQQRRKEEAERLQKEKEAKEKAEAERIEKEKKDTVKKLIEQGNTQGCLTWIEVEAALKKVGISSKNNYNEYSDYTDIILKEKFPIVEYSESYYPYKVNTKKTNAVKELIIKGKTKGSLISKELYTFTISQHFSLGEIEELNDYLKMAKIKIVEDNSYNGSSKTTIRKQLESINQQRNNDESTYRPFEISDKLINAIQIVDFEKPQDYSYSSVISVAFNGAVFTQNGKWIDTYGGLLKLLYNDYTELFANLKGTSLLKNDKIDIAGKKASASFKKPVQLAPDIYAETNFTAKTIVEKISVLAKYCWLSQKSLVILFIKNDNAQELLTERKKVRTKTRTTNKGATDPYAGLSAEERQLLIQYRKDKIEAEKAAEEEVLKAKTQASLVEASDAPIMHIGSNKTITNNIFSFKYKQIANSDKPYKLYFIDELGNTISNEKTIKPHVAGDEFKVSFQLRSAESFDKTKEYYLLICDENTGEIEGKIEYTINIAFASDFDL